jgi:murein DD-endopeptidase MepM/ murein hydrolase activator NlpD
MRSGVIVIAVASLAVTTGTSRIAPPTNASRPVAVGATHIAVPRPEPGIAVPMRATFEARVVVGGKPVAAADVRVSDGSELPPLIARADDEGIARFSDLGPGPFEVWAVGIKLASSITRVSEITADPIVLALEPASTVTGELIADGAAPASGVVQLTPLDIDHAVRSATLDAHGHFSIDGIPAGRWRVEATSPGFLQTTPQELRVSEPSEAVVVRLERAAAMTGTVVDLRGEPVANATIVMRRQGARGARPPAPAFGPLRWVYPFATRREVPTNESARFGASRPGTRPAECGDGHCGIDLVMPRGTIVHATGDGEVIVATTALGSEAGRFVAIDHGDGLVTMYMHLDQLRDGLEVGQVIRAGTPVGTVGSTGFDPTKAVPHLHFAITQHRGGRTWYLDPEAMLRRAVVLDAPRSLDRVDDVAALAPRAHALPAPAEAITTDARGRFRVSNLEPGAYVAVAFASDLAPAASEPITVGSGAAVDGVTLRLQPGTIVRGRITTRNGAIAGAAITASTGFGETASKVATTSSDAQGEFVLRALAGTITLSVSAANYGEAARTIDLAGRDASRADFTLVVEDAQLRGLVRSPFGGVPGARVRIVDGPTQRSATTDAAGQFTLQPVATGRYTLEVSSPDYPSRRFTLESDRFGEVRLEQGGGARVRVGDAREGDALAGIRVDARGPDGTTVTRTTDAHGIVELAGLTVGQWSFTVRGGSYAPITREITIRASRVPEDLRLDLAKAAILAGAVRDRRGTRVAGARVWAGAAETKSDADGNFRLTGVAIGTVLLEASLGDHHGQLALQLAPGDEHVTLGVELSE